MAAGAVSLRKSHDIVILSFCNIVKGRANYRPTVLTEWNNAMESPIFF